MKKKLLAIAICVAMLLCLCACAQKQPQTETTQTAQTEAETTESAQQEQTASTIKIALINALSGTSSEAGNLELQAAQMAIEKINAAGGIQSMGGAQLELVSYDYTSDANNTKSVVERVLSSEDVVAGVGGTTSGLLLPTLSVWESYEIPIVTENNAPDLTSQGYEYVFSVHCRGTEVGTKSVEFIEWLKTKGYDLNKAAIIYENSAKGISSAEGARSYCEQVGLEIVYDESHPNTITDVTSIVTAAKKAGAEVCFVYTLDQVSKLITTTMKDLSYNPITLSSNTTPSFYKALGDASNGILCGANWFPTNAAVVNNPEYKALMDEYEERYGMFIDQCGGGVYSSVMIIAQALEACASTDGATLKDTIASGTWKVLLGDGEITFNEKHESVGTYAVIGQWQDGHIVTVYPESAASGEFKIYE